MKYKTIKVSKEEEIITSATCDFCGKRIKTKEIFRGCSNDNYLVEGTVFEIKPVYGSRFHLWAKNIHRAICDDCFQKKYGKLVKLCPRKGGPYDTFGKKVT